MKYTSVGVRKLCDNITRHVIVLKFTSSLELKSCTFIGRLWRKYMQYFSWPHWTALSAYEAFFFHNVTLQYVNKAIVNVNENLVVNMALSDDTENLKR